MPVTVLSTRKEQQQGTTWHTVGRREEVIGGLADLVAEVRSFLVGDEVPG